MKKHLSLLILFAVILFGCKSSTDAKPIKDSGAGIIKHFDTAQILVIIDTLVIIQTYDTMPMPDTSGGVWAMGIGWESRPEILFLDHKRIDTIRKNTIIYK